MTLWRDLIDIPASLASDAFVLDLTRGVRDPSATLRQYVVTPTLAQRFDEALQLVQHALEGRRRRAAFLHGSFGAGKSHFMAVLHLLLQGNVEARNLPALAPVVAKHPWLLDKKFLLVPIHFIGARDIESKVLGGYVDYVQRLHPGSVVPPVFQGDRLLRDAEAMRTRLGDEGFLRLLNAEEGERNGSPESGGGGSDGGGSDWGDMASARWTIDQYDAARTAPPRDHERLRLISDLVTHVVPSMVQVAAHHGSDDSEAYVGLPEGLARLATHARDLKYDGLVLFLDELILWLMNQAGKHDFVAQEAPKIVQFVESDVGDAPIPVCTFIARQRRFEDFMSDPTYYSSTQRVQESLAHLGQRFVEISLEDRDLAPVAQERVLRPRNDDARATVAAAFARLWHGLDGTTRQALLGGYGDVRMFEAVFPFSPAIIETLVGLSSLLQRQRSALRLMVHILVRRRDALKVGDVVALGEIWDVLVDAAEPFSKEIGAQFDRARALWHERLNPYLAQQHNVALNLDGAVTPDPSSQAWRAYERDALLAKTLLLASLHADGVTPLRDLTVSRLVALNHGTVETPIPGEEVATVLGKLKRWAQALNELRVADDGNAADPVVTLRLTALSIDALLTSDRGADMHGARIRRVMQTMVDALGVAHTDHGTWETDLRWRGGSRRYRVRLCNVRELRDVDLRVEDMPTVFVDWPLDVEPHTPGDDRGRIEEFLSASAREGDNRAMLGVAWLPHHLTRDAATLLLGRLVMTEAWLKQDEDRLRALPVETRAEARHTVESARTTAEQGLKEALLHAYGLHAGSHASVDKAPGHDVFYTLAPQLRVRRPDATDFAGALRGLVMQVLDQSFPNAPNLQHESLTRARTQRIVDTVVAAIDTGADSHIVEDRAVRDDLFQWAQPLQLVNMVENKNRFSVTKHWREELPRRLKGRIDDCTVAHLRRALDPPDARTGLPNDLQDAIILVWAALTDRAFAVSSAAKPIEAAVGSLLDNLVVVQVSLPSNDAWNEATARANKLFNIQTPAGRNVRGVNKLHAELGQCVAGYRDAARELPGRLRAAAEVLGVTEPALAASARYQAAEDAAMLVDALLATQQGAVGVVERFANLALRADLDTVRTTLEKARDVGHVVEQLDKNVWARVLESADASIDLGTLLAQAREVLSARPAAAELRRIVELQREANNQLLTRTVQPPVVALPPQPMPTPPPPPPGLDAATVAKLQKEKEDAEKRLEEQRRANEELRRQMDAQIEAQKQAEIERLEREAEARRQREARALRLKTKLDAGEPVIVADDETLDGVSEHIRGRFARGKRLRVTVTDDV